MFGMKFIFDNIKHENDYYDRKEMIAATAKIFGETISDRELKKRAKLWYAADHLINAKILNKLSESPYIEVRESVAANMNTSAETLGILLYDEDFQVRETAVLNPHSPISEISKLLNDKHQAVRDAVKSRLKSE